MVVGITLRKQNSELIQKFSRKSEITKYSVYTHLPSIGQKRKKENNGDSRGTKYIQVFYVRAN